MACIYFWVWLLSVDKKIQANCGMYLFLWYELMKFDKKIHARSGLISKRVELHTVKIRIMKCFPQSKKFKGFSAQNLWRMKQFYETYCNADEKLAPLVREISW